MSKFVRTYLEETEFILSKLNTEIKRQEIENLIDALVELRERGGRLFFLGVGGGAANASHAVNDFRKICKIEAYAPTDNVPELTAIVNDLGWEDCFINWLITSNLQPNDGIFIFSVGGGSIEENISVNIVHALRYAKAIGASIFGIIGKDGGYTAELADNYVIIPTILLNRITPHTEGFQSILLHLIVSHPRLKQSETKWESIVKED